jgi:hypothetical protein
LLQSTIKKRCINQRQILHATANTYSGRIELAGAAMKRAMAMVLFGLVVAQFAQAEEPDTQRPHWVIVLTVIDRGTGKPLRQSKLGGPELEFESAELCKSILQRIKSVDTEQLTTVLTCRKKAAPPETLL